MSVQVSTDGAVARLTLHDPPLNILTRKALARIRDHVGRLARDASIRALILGADGENFSAGASVQEHLPPDHETLIPEFTATIRAVRDFPLPVVAAVRGRCLGGGFELALAADMVVAGEAAVFGVPEIRLGVFPPAACAMLSGRVPAGMAAELLFTGGTVDAATAARAGLVHQVVPTDRVDADAIELARRVARNSGAALRTAKAALRAAEGGAVDAALGKAEAVYLTDLMNTHDALEGLHAFVEKRRPQWSDR